MTAAPFFKDNMGMHGVWIFKFSNSFSTAVLESFSPFSNSWREIPDRLELSK
jgi:hypothetical protein